MESEVGGLGWRTPETGVYIIFLISAKKNIDCEYSLELTSTHNLCFKQKYEKYQSFFIRKFSVFGGEIFIYLNRRVFVMREKAIEKK